MAWFMPTLNPSSIDEYLQFGEYGYALSRFSGMWVGFKAVSETVESAGSVELHPDRIFNAPQYDVPLTGLHYRWPDLPGPQIEERMEAKKQAVFAFAQANPIDHRLYDLPHARFGIVTTGKAHLDLMEALRLLELDEQTCRELGIDIYKVGMVWPLARRDALAFVRGKREVLVIEEKRGIIESQFKEYFYDHPGDKPDHMVGKRDENVERLIPWTGELSPRQLITPLARRLDMVFETNRFSEKAQSLLDYPPQSISVSGATRTPYFCSGCPHNSSTKVPEGSKALAGIGCHFMASWMDRETTSLIQMGGEGVNWAASSKFTGMGHIFQNLGEGTYYHSGSMAIRQSIAAGANITYKILYNDAVAMTGGQPVDGPVSVEAIAHEVRAEGVVRIALVSDEPDMLDLANFPAGVTKHHRRDLDPVQRELRTISGVSVLIYQQACATEKRRRRKRGQMENPKRFAVINELVCEGCGDCSVESNCLSIEPVETEFGRKRQVNLSSCNKDFSCLDGFCPSFVTVEGATRRKGEKAPVDAAKLAEQLPPPAMQSLQEPYNLLVTGVGGTGVITVGALITMAAHLENKGATVLDFTGFAQKFGPVLSYIRLAASPVSLNQVRIDDGSADALIGGDIVVSSSPKASVAYSAHMRAVLNTAEAPTGDIVRSRDASLAVDQRIAAISTTIGAQNMATLNANQLAEQLLGDTVFANIILLGFAWQSGLVPVSLAALLRAIDLNNVAVPANLQAFAWGRLACTRPDLLPSARRKSGGEVLSLEDIIARHTTFLTDYQDANYAQRYLQLVERVQAHEAGIASTGLTETVARSLFKLMAYKDEYEVARLHVDPGFHARLREQFEGDFSIKYYLAPPFLPLGHDARGRPRKHQFGHWMLPVYRLLARLKPLRGTPFDPFGYSRDRRMERGLIDWFEKLVNDNLHRVTASGCEQWKKLFGMPMEIRGYGPVKEDAVARVKSQMEAGLQTMESRSAAIPRT